jgi:hypothetical protein
MKYYNVNYEGKVYQVNPDKCSFCVSIGLYRCSMHNGKNKFKKIVTCGKTNCLKRYRANKALFWKLNKRLENWSEFSMRLRI